MKHVLLFFLDGVGLGADDPEQNPFVRADLPTLSELLDGRRLLNDLPPLVLDRVAFLPTDTQLGVPGIPQSATGQATILTGRNMAAAIGQHWGPKPDSRLRPLIQSDNLFKRVAQVDGQAGLANAYPQPYFEAYYSGRYWLSAVPLAVTAAGLPLHTVEDVWAGRALPADFTGEGWRQRGFTDVPVLSLVEAGARLAAIAQSQQFTFFEHWATDFVGHRGTIQEGIRILERLDTFLGGLLAAWDYEEGLLIITSDHGNLEDLSHRHHTLNRVPTLLIGAGDPAGRNGLASTFDLTGIAPLAERLLGLSNRERKQDDDRSR